MIPPLPISMQQNLGVRDFSHIGTFDESEKVALKIQGLPFSIGTQDILNFFAGHNTLTNSVLLGKNAEGRRTGYGMILFQSAQDA